ncbi:substrate-binding periplasmic protein [Burkholderiaceae bacterium UC74_6]
MNQLVRILCCLLLFSAGAVRAEDLRFAVDESTEMPWAQMVQDRLVDGLQRDLGLALAEQMGRKAAFVVLPRKRLALALIGGDADLACALTPAWLPGPFDWSAPFIDNADVLLSSIRVQRPRKLQDLADVRIGTINGFAYPELEQALGPSFLRDDAPSAGNNLQKLEHGRIQHAVANQRYANYLRHRGLLTAPLHPPLLVGRQTMACAVSRQGQIKTAQVDAAIARLQASGQLRRLLERYP